MSGPTKKKSWFAWTLRAAAILALGGCTDSCDGLVEGLAFFIAAAPAKTTAKTAPSHYVFAKSKSNGAGATIRPNREIWKPFRVEATLGLFNSKHADLGSDGEFGFSLFQSQILGPFFEIGVKRSGAGVEVVADLVTTGPNSLTVADSLVVDLAIESQADAIVYSARKHGDATYTEIARSQATSTGPYHLSVDISGIPKGTIVGYTLVEVTNGAAPSPTAAQTQIETLYTAIDALIATTYAIDGPAPDRVAGGAQLDLAVARFDAALALDLSASVKKKTAAARKSTAALSIGVKGKKSIASALSSLRKILATAAQAVDPR